MAWLWVILWFVAGLVTLISGCIYEFRGMRYEYVNSALEGSWRRVLLVVLGGPVGLAIFLIIVADDAEVLPTLIYKIVNIGVEKEGLEEE